jgi:hypothetical protein
MISGDRFGGFFLLEQRVTLVFREFEMLPDQTFDPADLLQHGLVLGQGDLHVLLEDPENKMFCRKLLKTHIYQSFHKS